MALTVDTTAAFFRIREHTRGEFVSVGSDGNILRWSETKRADQDWLFLPMGDRKYRIMTRTDGNFMAVGSNGNILRWKYADNGSQIFSLVNEAPDGKLNIQEHTKGEFVAVGGNGNVLRWSKTSGLEQKFTLEPHAAAAKPTNLPAIGAAPGDIPPFPGLSRADLSGYPVKTDPVVVAVGLVPATLVNDSGYSDKIAQMEKNPYYVCVRTQHWSREEPHGYSYEHIKGEENTFEKKITCRVTNRSASTSEDIWSWKFSISAQNAASSRKAGIGVTATRGMAAEISRQLRTQIVDESAIETSSEERVTRHYNASFPNFVIVGWSLVDVYTLYKADLKTAVSQVEAAAKNSLRKVSFPADIPDPD